MDNITKMYHDNVSILKEVVSNKASKENKFGFPAIKNYICGAVGSFNTLSHLFKRVDNRLLKDVETYAFEKNIRVHDSS